ncbi:MAG: SHIRT domain-containing protein, partial [Eubacteriales bacterium]|nr:SHIRT domain-containing protein [Eubacteriales bacterium]
VTPTAPAKTTVETEEGTWTFDGYDENEKMIAGADAKFIGTWTFTPKTPATPQSILVKKLDFITGHGVEGAEFGLLKTSGGGQGGSAGAPFRPRLQSLLETMEAARPDSVAERLTTRQAELKTLKEQLAQLQQTIAQEEGKVPEESEPVLTAGEVNVTRGTALTEEQIVSAITLNGEALPESAQVLIDDSGLSTTEPGIYTVHVTLTFEDSSIRIIDVTVVVTEGADALNSEGADAFNSTDCIDSIEGNDIPDEDSGLEPDPESTPNPDPLADPQTESGQDEVTSIDPQEPQAFNGVRLCFTAAEMSDLKVKMAALEAEIAALEEQMAEDTAQLSDQKEALAQAQIQQTNQSDSLKTSLTLLDYTDEQISACCDPLTGLLQSYLLSPDQVDELMPTDIDMLAELETQIATLQAETLERDAYEALRQSLETAVEAQPVESRIMRAPTPGNGLTPIATGKTNARGELLFDNLEPGSYQIQELNAAAGYVPLTGIDAIWPKDTQGNPASVVVDQNGEQVVIQVVNKPYVNVHEDPLSPVPEGYVRIIFDATEDGTTDGRHRYTVIDVLEGLEWNDPEVTKHFPGNARPNSGDKTFEKWSPDIPTSGQVTNSVFVASYKGSPVTPPVPTKPTNEPDTGKLTVMMPLRTQPTVTELVPVKPVRTVVKLPRTGSAQTSAHVFGLIAAVLGAALLAYSKRLR